MQANLARDSFDVNPICAPLDETDSAGACVIVTVGAFVSGGGTVTLGLGVGLGFGFGATT